MTNVKDFIEHYDLPKFLANSKVLKSIDKVNKVFPGIGLPNCEDGSNVKNDVVARESAAELIRALDFNLYDCHTNLRWPVVPISNDKLDGVNYWINVILKLNAHFTVKYGDMIGVDNDGKVSIKMAADISDINGQVLFKKGESIFKVYNKCVDGLAALGLDQPILRVPLGIVRPLPKFETLPEFKKFSASNIKNNLKIVFSSDGVDGLWDIATMSMRGIQSCQSWDGQFKSKLIGSITDPFVGIIYLTSGNKVSWGKNKNHPEGRSGSNMIRRCLVRYLINEETKKPYLFIDRMYPSYDKSSMDSFISFLKKRVGEKLDIVKSPMFCYQGGPDATSMEINKAYDILKKSYIPFNPTYDNLTKGTKSYRDTKVEYKNDLKDKVSVIEKNIQKKKKDFKDILSKVSFQSSSKISLDLKKHAIKSIRGTTDLKYLITKMLRQKQLELVLLRMKFLHHKII